MPMLVMIATSGRAIARERRDLAGMIHPDLPDADLIVRGRLQHGLRQSDVVVEDCPPFS